MRSPSSSPERIRRSRRILGAISLPAAAIFMLLSVAWAVVTQPILSKRERISTPTVDPARLKAHVHFLSDPLFPRNYVHLDNLNRAADYIRKELEQAKGEVSYQSYEMKGKTYRNVIALFGPDTEERIVVGAHYDAYGEFSGADDNASGVAGLIELAYLLGNTSLPMRVELVAFTLEEPLGPGERGAFRTQDGGSAVHAESLKRQGIPVRIMFSLEMIGFFDDAENSQDYPLSLLKLFFPSRGNFISVVGKLDQGWAVRRVKKAMRAASSLPVYSINAPLSVRGIDWSDHFNYWEAGYTAVMVTDTSFLRNKHYHTEKDTPDRLDYERMAMVVQGVYGAVLAFAHEPA